MLMTFSFKRGEVMYLRERALKSFLGCINVPGSKLKPKAQLLNHYPSQNFELGPPANHNIVRFQAKNNFLKKFITAQTILLTLPKFWLGDISLVCILSIKKI